MAFAFDPSTKLVDLYVSGVWKCKLAYEKRYTDQQSGHKPYWSLVGPRFLYDENPGSAEIPAIQFRKGYPETVPDSTKKIEI